MSYTMRTRTKVTPTASALLGALADSEVRCREFSGGVPEGEWPAGIQHLHRVGHSTRGVEVLFEPGNASVRMVSLANRQDWDLALRILGAFSADRSAQVQGEDGTVASVAEASTRFSEVFSRETAAAFLAVRGAISANPGQVVQLNGAVRDVFLGERCLGELPSDPGDGAVALMERIRRIQYVEREGFAVRRPMGLPGSIGVRLTLWTPQDAQAFEETDNVGLSAPSGSLTVPVSELPGLAGTRFHWLDEKQFAIDATPESELAALYERAASVAVDPYRKAKGKRWWQFWA